MRSLLIDNYDSYTYNVYQLMAEVYGTPPVVVRNDDPAWDSLDLTEFDGAVISPGPGHPAEHRDFGHSRAALRRDDLPVLGVCLGHQGIGLVYGTDVVGAPEPRHGHLTQVRHDGAGVFAGLPQEFTAVRYHSLCVQEPLPAELEATAWSEDGVIMGLRHRRLPRWGVQFHPESICTEYGARLLANFRDLALAARPAVAPAARPAPAAGGRRWCTVAGAPAAAVDPGRHAGDPAAAASRAAGVLEAARPAGRRRDRLRLPVRDKQPRVLARQRTRHSRPLPVLLPRRRERAHRRGPDLPRRRPLRHGRALRPVVLHRAGDHLRCTRPRLGFTVPAPRTCPFELPGGYVGYFGYELKAICGAPAPTGRRTPDAAWLRADRFIAVDHLARLTYVVAVAAPADGAEALSWIERTSAALLRMAEPEAQVNGIATARPFDVEQWLVRPRAQYLADIAECQRQLRAGESYEICLTNNLRLPAPRDDLRLLLHAAAPQPGAVLGAAADR